MHNFIKKIALNKPDRKQIKITVAKFLEDGTHKKNENHPNVNEFIKYFNKPYISKMICHGLK